VSSTSLHDDFLIIFIWRYDFCISVDTDFLEMYLYSLKKMAGVRLILSLSMKLDSYAIRSTDYGFARDKNFRSTEIYGDANRK
jgi:hypothetical protein